MRGLGVSWNIAVGSRPQAVVLEVPAARRPKSPGLVGEVGSLFIFRAGFGSIRNRCWHSRISEPRSIRSGSTGFGSKRNLRLDCQKKYPEQMHISRDWLNTVLVRVWGLVQKSISRQAWCAQRKSWLELVIPKDALDKAILV